MTQSPLPVTRYRHVAALLIRHAARNVDDTMKPYTIKNKRGNSVIQRCGYHACGICGEGKSVRKYKSNSSVRQLAKLDLKNLRECAR